MLPATHAAQGAWKEVPNASVIKEYALALAGHHISAHADSGVVSHPVELHAR